jgi:hypothetical protein
MILHRNVGGWECRQYIRIPLANAVGLYVGDNDFPMAVRILII